jgi:four helix bundle protein
MRSHKEIHAWQAARASTLAIQRYAEARWTPARASILDQLRRASLSVMLNIAEGYACGPGARCRWHLKVAYASAVEATDLLELLVELGEDLGGEVELSRRVQALSLRLYRGSRSN